MLLRESVLARSRKLLQNRDNPKQPVVPMIVIDDFLPFYAGFLQRARTFQYYSAEEINKLKNQNFKWSGKRTLPLGQAAPLLNSFIENRLGIRLERLFLHKHEALPEVQGVLHVDGDFRTAGVIYLQGADGCGTIVDGKTVSFRENRLIVYDAQLLHAPEGFSADRLVITFFSHDPLPAELNK